MGSSAHNKGELSLAAHVLADVCLSRHLGNPEALVELGQLHSHHLHGSKGSVAMSGAATQPQFQCRHAAVVLSCVGAVIALLISWEVRLYHLNDLMILTQAACQ